MSEYEDRLAEYETEPIRTRGMIQPYGALLVVDEDGCCAVVSANVEEVIGVAPDALLGEPVAEVLGAAWTETMLACADGDAVSLDTLRGPTEAVVRLVDGRRFVEIERLGAGELDDHWRIYNVLQGFHGATTVEALLEQAVEAVQEITGFDRVFVYRFDEDGNGEVVTEVDRAGVPSLLGLRFPDGVIPARARERYVKNRLRLIPDCEAEPVPLLAADEADAATLDLSDIGLRALSPAQLQYYRNIAVRASMAAAIVVDDRLWGLITSHLGEPGHLGLRSRNAVDLVARTTSTVLSVILDADAARRRVGHLQDVDRLGDALSQRATTEPDEVLAAESELLLGIMEATGAAVVSGRGTQSVGACPPDAIITALVDEARRRPTLELVDSELAGLSDELAEHRDLAAGAVVVRVAGPEDRWIAWFRPETPRSIRWGSAPQAEASSLESPGSFQEHTEIVRGQSVPWADQQVEAARLVARRLGDQYAVRALHEAEIAATLQRTLMLERFPDAPGIDGAAQYVPSQREPIGGDWYDVFFRPQRNPTLVLGDVAGHGVEAAATMAQLRHALRAYILRAPSVAVAVSRLNDLITQAMPKEMATSIVAELDPERRRITMVNAGHFPPVVIDGDGAHLVELERGLALGIRSGEAYRETTITLPAGAAFVAYSDGLIESRTATIDEGLDLLVREAAVCSGLTSAEDIAARLADRVGSQSDTGDDLTVVVVRFVDLDDGDAAAGTRD